MAPSSGQVAFSYGATEILLPAPDLGYQTKVQMPFDFVELDDKTFTSRDEGTKYDKRQCECSFILTPAEQNNINTLVNSIARGKNLTMTLPSDSGFFPFGPDKGDAGAFTVAVLLAETPPIKTSPFRYFICKLIIVNVGAYPTYSLPTEVADGPLTIGSVSNLRMPIDVFTPKQDYSVSVNFTENNTAQYFDRGTGGDNASTSFTLTANESKAAALVNYLTTTIRTGTFNVTTPDYFYIFGVDHGNSGTYSVRLTSGTIVIKHNKNNEFELGIALQRIS